MDVDNIAPGLDFVQVLEEQVAACDALLVLIGRDWVEAKNASGQRRLDDPNDFVRVEVEAALRRNVRVVPILVDGAPMPPHEALPESLRPLLRRNAVELTHARFGTDVKRLTDALAPLMKVDANAGERTPQTDPAIQLVDGLVFERAALEHWESIKGTSDPKRLLEFLAGYGKSRMGRLAHDTLQRLATTTWPKVNKKSEASLDGFIQDFAGTSEAIEAEDMKARLRAHVDGRVQSFKKGRLERDHRPARRRLRVFLVATVVILFAFLALALLLAMPGLRPSLPSRVPTHVGSMWDFEPWVVKPNNQIAAKCSSPEQTSGALGSTRVSCDVWVSDAATFRGVTANVKGRLSDLDVQFEPRRQSVAVLFLIQTMEPARRPVMTPMLDAVIRIAEPRDNKHRYAAYTIANDLNLVADFGVGKGEFDKQLRAVRGAALPTQLYKGALEAIAKLAKEKVERKALVILGDGNSDDVSYEHEQVIKAAKEAGVIIHAIGFTADPTEAPKFQNIRRLAEDTSGFRRQVWLGGAQLYVIGPQFIAEAVENGGAIKLTLHEPAGPLTVVLTADLGNGRSEHVEISGTVPGPAESTQPIAIPTAPAESISPAIVPDRPR
jgi:hypothetical protein